MNKSAEKINSLLSLYDRIFLSDKETVARIPDDIDFGNSVFLTEGEDYEAVLDLYHTYCFSDRVIPAFFESTAYPSIFNFVKAGELTEREAFEILAEGKR